MPTLEDILYKTVDGVFAVDGKQRIIFWDPGCEELFDRSSHWVLGRPCHEVICGRNRINSTEFCKPDCPVAKLSQRDKAPNNFSIKTKDGEGKPIDLSVNIVLIPSFCKKKWIVTHLLHRFANQDVLTAIDSAFGQTKRPKARSLATSLGQCSQHVDRLSPREKEVLQLMTEGLSSTVIAKRLGISHVTIRNHIQHIQNKLNVHSQVEAVAYAYRHNLVH
ncbi:MAG: LuxR C-terminal-related transcriptional regulator [Gammaproteobacteria bacterium]|nr:LuxR C-terminal-related transcriptional regulator [Gammaproteobacteria bacterium]